MTQKINYGHVYDKATRELNRITANINRMTQRVYTSEQEVIAANNKVLFLQQRMNKIKELRDNLAHLYKALNILNTEANNFYHKYDGIHPSLSVIYNSFSASISAVENDIINFEAELEQFLTSVEKIYIFEVG